MTFDVSSPIDASGGKQGMAPLTIAADRPRKKRKKANKGGDAQTLRDYWSGHGHPGPSHGAERDAIRWGEPGDFNRCVAQVTVHGKMTPDQAKGYCNLRHHDALGYYPATHARMEGKVAEAEINKVAPDPGWIDIGDEEDDLRKKHGDDLVDEAHKLRRMYTPDEIARMSLQTAMARYPDRYNWDTADPEDVSEANGFFAGDDGENLETQAKRLAIAGHLMRVSRGADPRPAGERDNNAKDKPARTRNPAGKSLGPRNVRNEIDGRFRTFEGEASEAGRALNEGRVEDAMHLIGSARSLASDAGTHARMQTIEDSVGRTRARREVIPDIVKGFVPGEARVPSGSGAASGEFTAGGGGGGGNQQKPPGKKKTRKMPASVLAHFQGGGGKKPRGKGPDHVPPPPKGAGEKHERQQAAQLREQASDKLKQAANLESEIRNLRQQYNALAHGSKTHNLRGTGAKKGPKKTTGTKKPSTGTKKPSKASAANQLLSQINGLQGQVNALRASARALQAEAVSIVKKSVVPDIAKVGPEGYIHGWIKVGAGGDTSSHGHDVVGLSREGNQVRGKYDSGSKTVLDRAGGRTPVTHIQPDGRGLADRLVAADSKRGGPGSFDDEISKLNDHEMQAAHDHLEANPHKDPDGQIREFLKAEQDAGGHTDVGDKPIEHDPSMGLDQQPGMYMGTDGQMHNAADQLTNWTWGGTSKKAHPDAAMSGDWLPGHHLC